MNDFTSQIYLNRFPIHRLSQTEKTVQVYTYIFNSSPEPGKEYSAINKITWNIGGIAGVKFGSTIITKQAILNKNLKRENWTLQFQGTQLLNPEKQNEREALERLERRWLGGELRRTSAKNRVDNSSEGGFIWWNADKVV